MFKPLYKKLFDLPDPTEVAKRELRETQLELLKALARQENEAGCVITLKNRAARLQTQVNSAS
jgi:hypothetical protein